MKNALRDSHKPHVLGTPGCPIYGLVSRFGDKWSMLVLIALQECDNDRLRFSELMKLIDGISERMLTTTLRQLERDGMVTRHVFAVVPPRVDYALTPRCKKMLLPVNALINWLYDELPEIEKSRQEYDVKLNSFRA